MGDFTLSPLEERVLRALRDSEHRYLTIYQLAAELEDDADQLQSACRALKRRFLVTGSDVHGWALTGIGEARLAQLAIERARR